jgi:hypothetical protein
MEKVELEPVELQCVDGTTINIVGARREHHVETENNHWSYTMTILIADDGTELEFEDPSDVLYFKTVRDEVADKMLRVIDNPGPADIWWELVADKLLKLVASVHILEVAEETKQAD